MGEGLTLGIIISAALLDSINPCVLGVLIFLIAFLTKVFKKPSRMLLGGLWYSFIVYLTYLALGFGILKFTVFFDVANAIYWLAAIIALLAGLLEIKDFFWYGHGLTLQMLPGASKRIKMFTQKMAIWQKKYPRASLFTIGALGFFVVLVELPCTGAPYFAILALLSKGDYAQAVPYLLLYNFIFVIPLLVVIAAAYFGTASERLEQWRKKHRRLMRLLVGLFLLALGGYMVYSLLAGSY